MPRYDIIVMGASAGGVEALVRVVHEFPADLPASVFIVLHIPAQGPSYLPEILNHVTVLKALHPVDYQMIEHGCIYIAPPDHHLLIENGFMRIVRDPRENYLRPAVDPLFRSASVAYGSHVIGVILTGALGDGTAGLLAIKQRGGVAIVQDPGDALYPAMPKSALAHVDVDYCLPIAQIGQMLVKLVCEEII